jgi:hypothetical protein
MVMDKVYLTNRDRSARLQLASPQKSLPIGINLLNVVGDRFLVLPQQVDLGSRQLI